jgi:hypothetical protein
MNRKPAARLDSMLFPSPVLITERKEEFDELHAALTQELAPRGIVEKWFVADIANLVWEMRRLRRSKRAILDMASQHAVQQILRRPEVGSADRNFVLEASYFWLSHAGLREDIIEHLGASGLDESAIDAETMRMAASDLEMLDKMVASLEMRFRRRSAQLRITARPLPLRRGL